MTTSVKSSRALAPPEAVELIVTVFAVLSPVRVTLVPATRVTVPLRSDTTSVPPVSALIVMVASRRFSKLESPSVHVRADPFPARVVIVGLAM